jgi:hypothetical protein
VYGYPSHEYIIDHDELSSMGFDVGRFPEEQQAAVSALLPSIEEVDGSVVQLFEPAPVSSMVTVSAITEGRPGSSAEGGGQVGMSPGAESRFGVPAGEHVGAAVNEPAREH